MASDQQPTDAGDVAAIAQAVATLRRERDLSLHDVAARSGLSKSHVWELEQGRSRNPSVAAVRALASAFGVSMSRILGEDMAAVALSPAALKVAAMFDAELREAADGQ